MVKENSFVMNKLGKMKPKESSAEKSKETHKQDEFTRNPDIC